MIIPNAHEVFYYDETSPSCLRWKFDIRRGINKFICIAKDSPAGSINSSGYYVTKVDSKSVLCHRIIYEMFHGDLSGEDVVDHIDGNRLNNKITNIRKTTAKGNGQNKGMYSSNTSGVTGVFRQTIVSRRWSYDYWTASCYRNGKRYGRNFSIDRYGDATAFEMAKAWREKMIDTFNAEGGEYTDRHGQKGENECSTLNSH